MNKTCKVDIDVGLLSIYRTFSGLTVNTGNPDVLITLLNSEQKSLGNILQEVEKACKEAGLTFKKFSHPNGTTTERYTTLIPLGGFVAKATSMMREDSHGFYVLHNVRITEIQISGKNVKLKIKANLVRQFDIQNEEEEPKVILKNIEAMIGDWGK